MLLVLNDRASLPRACLGPVLEPGVCCRRASAMSRRQHPLWRNDGRSTATQRHLPRPRALRSRTTVHHLCADLIDHGIGASGPHPASGTALLKATLLGNTSAGRTPEEQCQGARATRSCSHDTMNSNRQEFGATSDVV